MAQWDTIDLLPPPNYGMISADQPTTMITVEKIRVIACKEDYDLWEKLGESLSSRKVQDKIQELRLEEQQKIKEGDQIMAGWYNDYAATLQTVLIRRRKHSDAV